MVDTPWPHGSFRDYKAFVVEVHIRRDQLGRIQSFRRLQSEVDEKVVQALPSGGVSEAAWALLTEAIRSELLLQLLVKLAADESAMREAMDKDMAEVARQFTINVRTHMNTELDRVLPGLVRDTLSEVRRQLIE